jgi:hypothetical protein
VFLCIADHWEPKWKRPSLQVEYDRVAQWTREYPRLASRFTDSMGRHPQHTFFYPAEEYESQHLESLAEICRQGFGDVEVHLHHDSDTAAGVRDTLCRFTETLHNRHDLLRKDRAGRLSYAFIHGNWALDNSRPDGRWCGVNNELSILVETGCYADLTMPSAPDPCQTRTINSIYYATDDPLRPKSHDAGLTASVGGRRPKDSLLMIQGPLTLDWSSPKWGVLPRLENGDLTANRPPTLQRLANWIKAGVKIVGRDDWSFVKLHTHGTQEANASMLLGPPMHEFHLALQQFAREYSTFHYYYVTAHELALLIHAAEDGATDPTLVLGRSSGSMQVSPAAISNS